MDQITTVSGKTAKDNIARLRQRRVQVQTDQTDMLVNKLEALADQSYKLIRSMREHVNALRLLAVDAKQTAMTIRKQQKLDVEL